MERQLDDLVVAHAISWLDHRSMANASISSHFMYQSVRASLGTRVRELRLQPSRGTQLQALFMWESMKSWSALHREARVERAHMFGVACAYGDLDSVRAILRSGMDINELSELEDGAGCVWKDSPLGWAIDGSHRHVLAYLLKFGADPNNLSAYGSAPIHLAAQRGDLESVKLLAASGATLSIKSVQGRDAIGWTTGNISLLYDGPESDRTATRVWLESTIPL